MLLAGCACAAATAASRPRLSEGWLFVAGVFAGAVPFAKLQAVPTALVLTLIIAGGVWQRTVSARGRLQAGMALAAGGLFVPACVMGLVVAGGAWDEFWSLYIEANVAYGDKRTVNTPLFMHVASMIAKSPIFTILCLMTATLAGLAIARCISDRRTAQFVPALASTAAMVAIAVFSVAKPGFEFGHYLMLLTLPCMLLSGASLATILSPANREAAASRSRLQPPAWAASAFVAAVPVIVAFRYLTAGATFVEGAGFAGYAAYLSSSQPSAESRIIAGMTRPADEIAVWGWRPDIYVESSRRPAVADAGMFHAMIPCPLRDAARRRFLDDLRRNKPRLFVDAVCYAGQPVYSAAVFGAEVVERSIGGHETFPELREYIARHYVGREQVLYDHNSSIRIYERRDAAVR